MECNPDDITPAFADWIAQSPIDRISMGAQTFSDDRLRLLRRRHTAAEVRRATTLLRQAGIRNISIDLMFGFPGETLADWEQDIDEALRLGVEHISAYSLMYEEGTTLHRWLSEESSWARGRTRERQEQAIAHSRSYSVHESGTGHQVGYARVVTDETTFAWLCDVFVTREARGSGAGKVLIEHVAADLDALGVPRCLLATADAHGLYAQYGFEPLAEPARWMTRGTIPLLPPER